MIVGRDVKHPQIQYKLGSKSHTSLSTGYEENTPLGEYIMSTGCSGHGYLNNEPEALADPHCKMNTRMMVYSIEFPIQKWYEGTWSFVGHPTWVCKTNGHGTPDSMVQQALQSGCNQITTAGGTVLWSPGLDMVLLVVLEVHRDLPGNITLEPIKQRIAALADLRNPSLDFYRFDRRPARRISGGCAVQKPGISNSSRAEVWRRQKSAKIICMNSLSNLSMQACFHAYIIYLRWQLITELHCTSSHHSTLSNARKMQNDATWSRN